MHLKKIPDFSCLSKYISVDAIFYIKKWLSPYWFQLYIKNPRNSKLGDYKFPKSNEPHKISINAGLHPSLFFFTLTHEIAHLIAFNTYSVKIAPHGKEWKKVFSEMILESINVYEDDLQPLLIRFSKSPKASYYASPYISEYFNKKLSPNMFLLKELDNGDEFIIKNKVFLKLQKIKTRYICVEKKSNKKYLISGSAPIEKIGYNLHEK